jgi:hypothetical protein
MDFSVEKKDLVVCGASRAHARASDLLHLFRMFIKDCALYFCASAHAEQNEMADRTTSAQPPKRCARHAGGAEFVHITMSKKAMTNRK